MEKHGKQKLWLATACLACVFAGCADIVRPDNVQRFDSPVAGLFFTVETWYGHGAVSPDFTRVYAHLEAKGKTDRELVLDGEYLEETKVTWLSPTDVTLCVETTYHEGYTDHFRTYVTLSASGVAKTIHSHYLGRCQP
jgi:hypothetical protein